MRTRHAISILCAIVGFFLSFEVLAHVSQQGLVLLLPTHIYIASGVLVVALTLALVSWLPAETSEKLFVSRRLWHSWRHELSSVVSVMSTAFLIVLVYLGFTASYDPLENPLPLFIWTVWWVGFLVIQGFLGDLWSWVNPWSGVAKLAKQVGWVPRWSLPVWVQQWPAVITFLCFISFSLADPAPDAPARLAAIVSAYWCFTMLAVLLFGTQWQEQGECFTVLLRRFSQLAPIGAHSNNVLIGLPGWKAVTSKATTVSGAVFILILLGSGSFDGFNETFLWLSAIGVNPLEFPGRSSIIMETVLGLLIANAALIAAYALCVYLGLYFVNRARHAVINSAASNDFTVVTFKQAFCALAIAMLPIAFAYHFAHFLTSFMVNIQYALVAVSDPFDNGSDLLRLGSHFVTTGFFNTTHSVKLIWLSQAGAVVVGHVLSVLVAHAIAVDLFGSRRRAILSQVALAGFMVVYTFVGLWLLAAPKGG